MGKRLTNYKLMMTSGYLQEPFVIIVVFEMFMVWVYLVLCMLATSWTHKRNLETRVFDCGKSCYVHYNKSIIYHIHMFYGQHRNTSSLKGMVSLPPPPPI